VSDFNSSKKPSSKGVVTPVDRNAIPASCGGATAIDNITTFAKCDTPVTEHCQFTLAFKKVKLCKHPLVHKIVERTSKKP